MIIKIFNRCFHWICLLHKSTKDHLLFALKQGRDIFLFFSHCHAGLSAHDFKCGRKRMSLHKRYRHKHTHIETHSGLRTESWKEVLSVVKNQEGKQQCLCIPLNARYSLCYIKNQSNKFQPNTNIYREKKEKCA